MQRALVLAILLTNLLFVQAADLHEQNISYPTMKNDFVFQLSKYPFFATRQEQESKTNFISTDEIYGKIILPQTVADYYRISNNIDGNDYFLEYSITVTKDGKSLGITNTWRSLHISAEEISNNFLIMDILPDGLNASSRIFQKADITSGFTTTPLGWLLNKDKFVSDGIYTITITIASQLATCQTTFSYLFKADDLEHILQKTFNAELSIKERIGKHIKPAMTGLPFEWNMKTSASLSGFDDLAIIDLFKEKIDNEEKIVKTIVEPVFKAQWIIENSERGQPKRKFHNQIVFLIVEQNGRYKFFEGHLQQDYQQTSYGKVFFNLLRSGEYSNSKPFRQALQNK